jgi:putative DNA primase/helicase
MPLAPMPAWLLELVTAPAPRQGLLPSAGEGGEPIPDGQRNATLTSYAGTMRRRGMTVEEIAVALLTVNARRCQPPLDRAEVCQIAMSIARYTPGASLIPQPQDEESQDYEHLTDLGNAKCLVAEHGLDLHYCFPWGKWLYWDGTRWVLDETGEVMRRAKDTVAQMYREALQLPSELRKPLLTHVERSESAPRLKAMIELAASEPGIPIRPAELDANPWLLNVENGTLDLHTGDLHEPRREDLLTRLAPVRYDPEATCPQWDAFLARIMAGNQSLISFLQRAVGYALTGDVREHVMLILWGTGRNGKSTFLNTVMAMLGPYAMKAASDLLIATKGDRHPTERADLSGKRLVAALESGEGQRFDEVFVKEATGGDPIRARRMREDFWEFWPTHKIFLATNHKPVIKGTDEGIWRRIRLVPFTVTLAEAEQDKTLPEKLRAERSGILRWAVAGCLAWQREGLNQPDEVSSATEAYREEMDAVGRFLTERCLFVPARFTTTKALYDAYCT